MYLPLETTFFIKDDYSYSALTVGVTYPFDSNGWNTALMAGSSHGTSGGNGASIGAPQIVDGYTSYGHCVARIYNNTLLDVTQPISFEFAYATSAGIGDSSWAVRMYFVDEDSSETLATTEPGAGQTNTKIGMLFEADYSKLNLVNGGTAAFDLAGAGIQKITETYASAVSVPKKIAVRIVIGESEGSAVYINGVKAFDLDVTQADFPSGYARIALFPLGGTDFLLSGFGNPVNVIRTVREYERAGAAAIQLEDQTMPKKCGHMLGRQVVPAEEMAEKIRAAAAARGDPDFLIIARTDARTEHGIDEAIRRGRLYEEAGADIIFIESLETVDEMKRVNREIRKPTIANMVEGGRTPFLPARELQEIGYSAVIFPITTLYAAAKAVYDVLADLRENGTSAGSSDRMLCFREFNELIGLPAVRKIESGDLSAVRRDLL